MSDSNKPATESAIQAAIRAKRDRQTDTTLDLAAREAALLADLENFDLDAAQRDIGVPPPASTAGVSGETLSFPKIVDTGSFRSIADRPMPERQVAPVASSGGSLLDGLRAQAENRLQENDRLQAQRSEVGASIDVALKQLFFYLHDLVQQLNVIHPVVDRDYLLIEDKGLSGLAWQEGFTDYRAQPQSRGGYVELVTLSCQLAAPDALRIHRNSLGVDRFRTFLYDYGLFFACKEQRDARGQLEGAEFEIPAKLAVSARWQADFARGTIELVLRNLERLGNTRYSLRPAAVDQALCEAFARLMLGQPNTFRELARR